MRNRNLMVALVLLPIATSMTSAAAPPAGPGLDVATGLWEMSITMDIAKLGLPQSQLDKLSPEQRATVQAALGATAGKGPKTMTHKSCVKPEDLHNGKFAADKDDDDKSCKTTVLNQTSTRQEATQVCTGEEARTVHYLIEATDRTHVRGTIKMDGENMHGTMTLSGHQVAATCTDADED